MPSILSGVDPGGATDAYGKVTSFWAIGKAAHARTFLFASAGWSFSHFDEYFIDANIAVHATGTELPGELVGNGGDLARRCERLVR